MFLIDQTVFVFKRQQEPSEVLSSPDPWPTEALRVEAAATDLPPVCMVISVSRAWAVFPVQSHVQDVMRYNTVVYCTVDCFPPRSQITCGETLGREAFQRHPTRATRVVEDKGTLHRGVEPCMPVGRSCS